jgi:hypothetical protein
MRLLAHVSYRLGHARYVVALLDFYRMMDFCDGD